MSRLVYLVILIFFLVFPLVFSPTSSELFELPKFLLLICVALVLLSIYLVDGVTSHNWKIPQLSTPLTLAVLGLLCTQLISTLVSIDPHTSFWGYYSRFHQGLFTTFSYTVIYLGIIKYLNLRQIKKILFLTLASTVLIVLVAVLEHHNLSLTCPIINLYKANSENTAITLNRAFISTQCWKETTNPLYRSFSTLGQPNWLAAFLIPQLFLLFYLYRDKLRSNRKTGLLLYAFASFFIVLAVLYTKSRSGYLALCFASLFYFFLLWRHQGKNTWRLFIPLLLSGLLATVVYFSPSLIKPNNNQPSAGTADTQLATISTSSAVIRQIVWQGALKLFLSRPLLGFGPETFAYTYYQVRPLAHNYTTEWDFLYNKAHNEYLNFLATSGLIGLTAYLVFHFFIFKEALSPVPISKKVDREREFFLSDFRPVLGASLISFTITNFFGFSTIPVFAYLILYAAASQTRLISHQISLSKNSKIIAILIMLFLLTLFPLRIYLADRSYNLSRNLSPANNLAEAIRAASIAVSLRPGEPIYHSYLAELYSQAGNESQALAEIKQSETNIHSQNLLKSRAKSYINLAQQNPSYYQQAVKELVQAAALAPTDPKLFYNLGLLYSRLGESDNTIIALKKSLELKNDYPEPYYALTLVYESTKQENLVNPILEEAKLHISHPPENLQQKITKYLGE